MSKALKRKRTDSSQAGSKKKASHKAARLGPIVRGDALKWKEVVLPDRLDDAEGFYALEEIDDVELIKDETGQISFRPKTEDDVIVGDGEVAGEEWDGFADENGDHPIRIEQPSTVNGEASAAGPVSKANGAERPSGGTERQKQKATKKEKKALSKKPKATAISKLAPGATGSSEVEDEIDFNALDSTEERVQADITAWKELGLSPEMLSAISNLGFSDPTPIQKSAIPPIQEGRDVIGKAVTGSGKTLAFGIPILERWLENKSSKDIAEQVIPTAFILAPTRELAHQLSSHLVALSKSLDQTPRITTVTGGLAIVKQQRQLENADIIIGTPGRLWEVINNSRGLIDRLKQIQFLVIDEADRLLSEGHFKEVEEILSVLDRKVINDTEDDPDSPKQKVNPQQPQKRQTLVFSATFHKGLQQRLSSKQKWQSDTSELLSNSASLEYLLRKLKFQRGVKPTFVDANPTSSMAEKLTESIVECGAMQKDLYLYSLLLLYQHQHAKAIQSRASSNSNDKITRTLIFTNSISTVKRLVPLLATLDIPKTTVLPLHSSMPQKSRLRSLERFAQPINSSDTTAILIATDVAARGLDIKGVNTVIHYHVPRTADMYVHRSGRTARASSSGRSILISSPDETAGVTRLISKIHLDQARSRNNRQIGKGVIQSFYLPASLPNQLQKRVSLAQRIAEATMSTTQVKSEESWLRNAAEELGVDYSSDEFEANAKQERRGRGGGREQRKKEAVQDSKKGNVAGWKAELKEEMKRSRIDFGDGTAIGSGRYLAGGAVDVERLLRDGID